LQRKRADQIAAALRTLDRLSEESIDPAIKEKCVIGVVEIHDRLAAGWPGFSGDWGLQRPQESDGLESLRRFLIEQCYIELMDMVAPGGSGNAFAKAGYLKIEPSDNELRGGWLARGRYAGFLPTSDAED
jgi:hypothetical protein